MKSNTSVLNAESLVFEETITLSFHDLVALCDKVTSRRYREISRAIASGDWTTSDRWSDLHHGLVAAMRREFTPRLYKGHVIVALTEDEAELVSSL